MIERMKKLTILGLHQNKSEVLIALQDLGTCHIQQHASANNSSLSKQIEHIQQLDQQIAILEQISQSSKIRLPQKSWRVDLEQISSDIDRLSSQKNTIQTKITELGQLENRLLPWGSFDPQIIAELDKAKVKIDFCSCSRPVFNKLKADNVIIELITDLQSTIYYLAIYRKGRKLSATDKLITANSIEVPSYELADIGSEIAELEEELADIDRSLIEHSKYIDVLSQARVLDKDCLALEWARSSSSDTLEGKVWVLEAWLPSKACPALEATLEPMPIVWFIDEPGAHDQVPVKLKHNPFTRLFQPIMRLFSLPNYHEVDPTPFFAPFYAIFFGLCLADVGYGILIFIGAALALFKIKAKEARRYIYLGLILSLSAMLAGIILDDFFGARLATEYIHEGSAALGPGLSNLGQALTPLALFKTQTDAMLLPMMLGIIQVLLGWFLRIRNQIKHCGWQGFGQPSGNILILVGALFSVFPAMPTVLGPHFAIGPLPIGYWLCSPGVLVGQITLIAGLVLVLFFNGAEKGRKWLIRPAAGLWSLYELGTGIISDVLSYLRLFALGLAGGLLAEAVNDIAFNIIKDSNGLLPYFFMVAVLLVGHGLNLGLGLLSAFVHSLRLQFVEFYKAVEFKGGGLEYQPLASHYKAIVGQKR